MKCPGCGFENLEKAKFCNECGTRLEAPCPSCSTLNQAGSKFCQECGASLAAPQAPKPRNRKTASDVESERKHVTVLFSDLSGYTSMTERLDPEEVKEIMSRIFGEIAQVIIKYEGFIERFVGDAVMAIFGVPKAHEDDPVRAVKAAIEIHKLVEQISPKLKEKTGVSLSMHSGINTGLVVTGEVKLDQGTHGLTGDVINTAARFQGLAKTGEILVGYETYRQTEGFFDYEQLEAMKLKGKEKPVPVYRMISPKDKPFTLHRLSGVRADLIGRKSEISLLHEALQNLKGGKGSIFSICGDAGTGKSRLAEDFKADFAPGEIQVFEGHAYAHTQNIPYYPLIDFFNGVFGIEEADPPEKVRDKILSGVESLLGKTEYIVPFIGNLYSLDYPELSNVSPDLWKHRIQEGAKAILSALCRRMPTVFFLEDLHWADSAFLELLRKTLYEIRDPALVLCAYRPPFSLFTIHQLGSLSGSYHEIRLQDLSQSEAQDMVCSLLKTDSLPPDLRRFVQGKAEGNPFYLEEVINSLIESKALVQDGRNWVLIKQIDELEISSSIHGVILARLDRLEKESKRILQEASVIGRAFLYEILKMITDNKDQIDRCLNGLERLDLIRTRSLQPDLEYVFKHVLTQEAVYNGLLKKERQEIHERIGSVMEHLFRERLPEFYETLALHFKQGLSVNKAVEYLMKAGSKSFSRCAVRESHQYYKEAYDILSRCTAKTREEETLLIDLLNEWGFTFVWQGAFAELRDLFKANEKTAESIGNKEKLGLYYSALGVSLGSTEELLESYDYLHKSIELGEQAVSPKVIGHSCFRLAASCSSLGRLDEAVEKGERAYAISKDPTADLPLCRVAFGLGPAYWARGDITKLRGLGMELLEEGKTKSDPRHLATGEMVMGFSSLCCGDFQSAVDRFKAALNAALDPLLTQFCMMFLGYAYLGSGQYGGALSVSEDVMRFSEVYSSEITGTMSLALRGYALAATGDLNEGLKLLRYAEETWQKSNRQYTLASIQIFYGQLYLRIVEGSGPKSFSFMAKNIRSLIKLVPGAGRKAEEHFKKAIEISNRIGAQVFLAQAHMGLGMLYKAKGKKEQAAASISSAVEIFEKIGADVFLKQAKEALLSL